MSFQVVSSNASETRGKYVTLDKSGRLMLSAGLRELLHTKGVPIRLHVACDPETKRLAIQKPELVRQATVNIEPFKFDKRGYTNSKLIPNKLGLTLGKPYKFAYAGDDFIEGERWFSFELVTKTKV